MTQSELQLASTRHSPLHIPSAPFDRLPNMIRKLKTLVLVALCSITAGVQADDTAVSNSSVSNSSVSNTAKQVYKAVGGPTNPQVPVYWNRYHDGAEITKILQDLAAKFPDLFKVQSVGKSHEGREMWVATITNFKEGDPNRKPGFWIDAGIHANEIQANEVALYTAWFLAEMHAENRFVQDLLRDRVFYILPSMSPDSREAHFYKANSTNTPRSGQLPVDDDRDGLVNEDPANDLNRDGHITQMRVRDPNGRFKAHKKYPNLMIPVEEGEKGDFTLLGQEGIDADLDGRSGEDGDGFYDPNRDWPWKWQPDYVQRGAYRYPFSLMENRHMAEFVKAHPNIAGAQTYHNTGGMILRGPGSKQDAYEAGDLRVYDEIGKVGEKILPGYRYMNVANDLYEVWGGEIDWFHQMLGVFTFTNELFIQYNYFHVKEGDNEQTYEFDKLMLLGDGLVPWVEVNHPVYGKVEVGGLKKNWGRQPPGFMLQEECHRNMAFTLYHADQMPLVKIREITSKPLGGGLTEITVAVDNLRVTPTHSSVDRNQKITRPDLVSLKGTNLKVLMGQYSSDSLLRNATIQDRNPDVMRLPVIPGKSTVYVRWIVSGQVEGEVSLDTIKGGQDRKQHFGDDHSKTRTPVSVDIVEDHERELIEVNKRPEAPVEHGKWLYERRGCKDCHSIDTGKVIIGPSFAGSWGKEVKDAATGVTLKFDEKYVQESMVNPQKVMRSEFLNVSRMPSYKGRFKPKELAAITAFMKALEDEQITLEELSAMPPTETPAATGDGAAKTK